MAEKSKRSKRKDMSPARPRYWNSGKLAARKIKHLVRSNGFATVAAAREFWLSVRKRNHTGRKTSVA